MLREIAQEIGIWEWIWVDGSKVIVVAAGRINVLAFNFILAIVACIPTDFIDMVVISIRIGIILAREGLTVENLILASGFGPIKIVHGLLVERLINSLNAISVVVSNLRIRELLFQ